MPRFNYKEQLKTPEWKQQRDKVVTRDGCCQYCGSFENLEVHHLFYFTNLEPQRYSKDMLVTLCRDCHSRETKYSRILNNLIKYMKYRGLMSFEIVNLYFKNAIDSEFLKFQSEIEEVEERNK